MPAGSRQRTAGSKKDLFAESLLLAESRALPFDKAGKTGLTG